MAIKISDEQRTQLEGAGMLMLPVTGGAPKRRYWTPDGRVIMMTPQVVTRKFRDGSVDQVDANYDKGWLTVPPKSPLPYCSGCDNWHDTEEEVKACVAEKAKTAARWEAHGKKKLKETDSQVEIEGMRAEMSELKDMVAKLLEEKHG